VSPAPQERAGAPNPRVFICYRRDETAAHAGRLYDAMVARLGEGNVFMDVDMEPGVDFVERINQVVSACQVLIVVMGPSWATVKDETGELRISDPNDFVRLEVETALRRPEVTPIPVLVSGARMPRPEALPPEVQAITRRNALELSEARWHYDVERLNSRLDELLTDVTRTRKAVEPSPAPAPAPSPAPVQSAAPILPGARLVLEGMLVAGATALVARLLAGKIPDGDTTASEIVGVAVRRGITWGATGTALAIWLAIRTKRTDFARLAMLGLLIGVIGGALGGAIWGAIALSPDPDPGSRLKNWLDLATLALTGGFLGALVGGLWRPPRLGVGLAGGVVGGMLGRLIVNLFIADEPSNLEASLAFFVGALAIAGVTLAAMRLLDRGEAKVEPSPLAATDP
jgi:hypothetical protein